jgi:hypothetical protein
MGIVHAPAPQNVRFTRTYHGNIRYSELKEAPGEIFTLKVNADKLLLLRSAAFLYSAKVAKVANVAKVQEDGTALISVKDIDKAQLMKILGEQQAVVAPTLPAAAAAETEKQRNFRVNNELKLQSIRDNDKLCYKVVTPEQLKRVKLGTQILCLPLRKTRRNSPNYYQFSPLQNQRSELPQKKKIRDSRS